MRRPIAHTDVTVATTRSNHRPTNHAAIDFPRDHRAGRRPRRAGRWLMEVNPARAGSPARNGSPELIATQRKKSGRITAIVSDCGTISHISVSSCQDAAAPAVDPSCTALLPAARREIEPDKIFSPAGCRHGIDACRNRCALHAPAAWRDRDAGGRASRGAADVPANGETALTASRQHAWSGPVGVTRGTPDGIFRALNREITRASRDPAFIELLRRTGRRCRCDSAGRMRARIARTSRRGLRSSSSPASRRSDHAADPQAEHTWRQSPKTRTRTAGAAMRAARRPPGDEEDN